MQKVYASSSLFCILVTVLRFLVIAAHFIPIHCIPCHLRIYSGSGSDTDLTIVLNARVKDGILKVILFTLVTMFLKYSQYSQVFIGLRVSPSFSWFGSFGGEVFPAKCTFVSDS